MPKRACKIDQASDLISITLDYENEDPVILRYLFDAEGKQINNKLL